jgi:hypothetical protein
MVDGTCRVDGCERPLRKLQMCTLHYQRFKRLGQTDLPARPTAEERFWAHVEKTENCWLWTAGCDAHGYGQFGIGRKVIYVHRFAYELLIGPIPATYRIDHRCHNTVCVNPQHLRLATIKQNAENMRAARRDSTTGIRGITPFSGRWRAEVRHNRRNYHVGVFSSIEDAEAAVIAKRNELFTHNDLDRQEAV